MIRTCVSYMVHTYLQESFYVCAQDCNLDTKLWNWLAGPIHQTLYLWWCCGNEGPSTSVALVLTNSLGIFQFQNEMGYRWFWVNWLIILFLWSIFGGGVCVLYGIYLKPQTTHSNAWLQLSWGYHELLASAWTGICLFSTFRLRQNGHHFPDNIFKCAFLNENV